MSLGLHFSTNHFVKDVLGSVFDKLHDFDKFDKHDYRPVDHKPHKKPDEHEKPDHEKPEGHKPPEHKPPEEKPPEHKPPEEKPDEPDKVVHDECGDNCYKADDCYDEKFVFDHKSGGKDTIKCFDGKQGDRIDICGEYCVEKNDCGDVVINWDNGTITLEGVNSICDNWIV